MEHPGPLTKSSIDLLLVVVVSRSCLVRECVSQALAADGGIEVLVACTTVETAIGAVRAHRPHLVLLDARFPDGPAAAGRLRDAAPDTGVVAIAADDSPDPLAWTGARLLGAIPESASIADFPSLLRRICRDDRPPAAAVAGHPASAFRELAPDRRGAALDEQLTPRERLIGTFIGAGMSNAEIARKLDISVGTAKSHVHNLLGKLNLRSRAQVAARLHGSLLRT